MVYGPFLTSSVGGLLPEGNLPYKGISIRVGPQNYKGDDSAVVFDTDLLRHAAGWNGNYLNLKGVTFDGEHWAYPTINGDQIFGNRDIRVVSLQIF